MIEALDGDAGTLLGLGENEGTLDDGLGVESEALGAPWHIDAVLAHRFGNVGFDHCGVFTDILVTRLADERMRFVDFLHHGAEEASELGQSALEDRLAKIDVAEEAIHGVGQGAIGRCCEYAVGHRRKMPGGRDRQFILAFEMVEETAFGDARSVANVVDCGGRITFGADNHQCCIEKFHLRIAL